MALTATQVVKKLKARRDTILTRLADLEFGDIGDKPDSSGEGSNLQHQQYIDGLYRQLELIDAAIKRYDPVEVTSIGLSR